MKYVTKYGDMVDAICAAHYGTEAMTATVYEENRGLAKLGLVLPAGIEINLPELQPELPVKPIRLWG